MKTISNAFAELLAISYTDMSKMYATKAKRYNAAQCKAAITDIDATLAVQDNGNTMVPMTPYVTQLFCERDAMLDRLHSLR